MKHRVAGRKLGRTSAHRLAMLRNLTAALFERERIQTTLGKAKELRPFAERLVTLSKRETLHARRQVLRHIQSRKVVSKLFDTLSARFAQRPGGYTRILKLGPRRGDGAEMAIVELVGSEPSFAKKKAPEKGKTERAAPSPTPAAEERAGKTRKEKAAATPAREKKEKERKPAKAKKKAAGKAAPEKERAEKKGTAASRGRAGASGGKKKAPGSSKGK